MIGKRMVVVVGESLVFKTKSEQWSRYPMPRVPILTEAEGREAQRTWV